MEKERTNFEVYDWLKENQEKNNYSDEFIDSYKDTYFLNHLEGKVFHGEYCGFRVKPDNSDKSYFVEEGVRGYVIGYFTVINNKLIKLDPVCDDFEFTNKYRKNEKIIIKNFIDPREEYLKSFMQLNTLSDNEKMMINEHIQSLEFITNFLCNI